MEFLDAVDEATECILEMPDAGARLYRTNRLKRQTPKPGHSTSRCTVSGEKAGRHTAMYSAPPAFGVL
jgi:hypothetical protein